MPRFVNLFLLIIGFIVVVVGWASASKTSGFPVVFVVGAIVAGLALLSDHWRAKRAEAYRQSHAERRITELTSDPWQPGQRLLVRGSAGMFLGLAVVALICFGIIYGEVTKDAGTDYPMVVISSALLPIVLISLARTGAGLFNPVLQLNAQGIVTPIHGRIPWDEIKGIDLQRLNNRGFISYLLHFRVEQYRKVVKEVHWTERLLGLFGTGAMRRGYITISIKDKHEQPETVHVVARFLWKQATGWDYVWSPMMSNAANTAARNVGHIMAEHRDMERIYQRMKSEPEKVREEVRQMEDGIAVIRQEGRRRSREMLWVVVVVVGLLVLSALWSLLGRR